MAALPENMPAWAKVGVQWALIGAALVYAYADMQSDVNTALESLVSMNQALVEIKAVIATDDVERAKQARLEADVFNLQNEVRSLLGWRDVMNRERAGARPPQ